MLFRRDLFLLLHRMSSKLNPKVASTSLRPSIYIQPWSCHCRFCARVASWPSAVTRSTTFSLGLSLEGQATSFCYVRMVLFGGQGSRSESVGKARLPDGTRDSFQSWESGLCNSAVVRRSALVVGITCSKDELNLIPLCPQK